ncbi:MAG: NAD(+) diphosphatase [Selenomonas sp.]|nr:NAD(+) diphosphatase [Selenomonas sp.]
MIQDIAPRKLRNEYRPEKACGPKDTVICVQGGSLLVREGAAEICFPLREELPADAACRYLFSIDERDFYLAEEVAELPGYHYLSLRDIRYKLKGPRFLMYAAYTAFHLAVWYRDNKFCGRCGSRTVHSESERALKCPDCGHVIYPRLMPAVIVGVINGDSILMTKYANRPMSFYALIAGFTEIGETLEECVAREVMEDAGLKVKNLRYYKSQPWGSVQDLLMGFYCDVDGDTEIKLERNELKEGRWVPRAEIEGQTDDLSLTNEMMMVFKEGREPGVR